MFKSIQRWLIILLPLLVAACFERVVEIHTTESSEGITFEVPALEAGLLRGQAYELLDLTVMRRADCNEGCTMWFLVRDTEREPGGNLRAVRIVYGQEPEGMVRRAAAKVLEPGTYSVSATVQEYDVAGRFHKSITLDGDFFVYLDPSGTQRVSREPSTGDR